MGKQMGICGFFIIFALHLVLRHPAFRQERNGAKMRTQ